MNQDFTDGRIRTCLVKRIQSHNFSQGMPAHTNQPYQYIGTLVCTDVPEKKDQK